MNRLPLDVLVIETPSSMRGQSLLTALSRDSRIRLHQLPAIMISTKEELTTKQLKVNERVFWALTGRYPLLSELGCAESHNLARREIANLELGGVILEDDATIPNIDLFFEVTRTFLEQFHERSALLNLGPHRNLRVPREFSGQNSFIRLFGPSSLAVGYALTSIAARKLVGSNDPIHYVSDWPMASVKHFCLEVPLVGHGEGSLISTIDPLNLAGRNKRNFMFAWKKWSLLDYFFRARKYVSLHLYFEYNIKRSVLFRLDSLKLKIRQK